MMDQLRLSRMLKFNARLFRDINKFKFPGGNLKYLKFYNFRNHNLSRKRCSLRESWHAPLSLVRFTGGSFESVS